jgi:hypothetical protein
MRCKKGIIFALDGAIAISVVLIMLINTTYYFTTTSQESLSQSQVIKRGYDVIAMYDEAGRLDSAFRDVESIHNYISEDGVNGLLVSDYLPNGYNMTILLHDAAKTPCFGNCDIPMGPSEPYTQRIGLKPLTNGGDLYLQANVITNGLTSVEPLLLVMHNGIYYPMTSVCNVGEKCTYTTKERVKDLQTSPNTELIRIASNNQQEDTFTVNWVKALDDPADTLNTSRDVPTNQFIGGGSRWFAAFDANGHFEGTHKASFRVWIEGDIPE